ncbi:Bug family tripartite tricarboxylate transporter substrate binding protein [Sphaerotilus mobilis]|uniref:Tripartite-type tricarboxylate transporter receptor subunit TctC n=1 Tax=Sphaerotilus mobilis TaxID=47994 RepID=A0A4V2EVN8_9BURK|nr:tripartite tricarboxylate transporter substrate binding protein [Sphaerotilus mobilis]RZS53140.1 tripartite-type tricarboxylate transporter receptor subunit TctC [Sphaerotilus mobilis]
MRTRRLALLTACAAAVLAASAPVAAQTYPDRQVKLVVGFPPGSGPDVVARHLGQKLGDLLKQQVVVDNRAGAGGQIAAQAVARSPADGYTLLLGEVGSISISPAAYGKLPYDPARDLQGVAEVVRSDFVLVVPADSPSRSVADFVSAAKAQKDKVNIGTFGAGTPGHFGAEVFGSLAGFAVEPVHYRATGDAISAIITGDVKGAFVSTALAMAQVKGGKMRALATTAAERSPLLPDVPTFTESGYPKADFSAWFAVLVPTGTPTGTLDLLNRQTVAAIQSPEVRQKLQEAGFTVIGSTRSDTERMLKSEATRWSTVVKATGFKAD